MAKTELTSVFANISGKLNKNDKIVNRQKKHRAENGAIISTASHEAYEVLNPRDYKKKPAKGAELANIRSFADASRLTTLIIRPANTLTTNSLHSLKTNASKHLTTAHNLNIIKLVSWRN